VARLRIRHRTDDERPGLLDLAREAVRERRLRRTRRALRLTVELLVLRAVELVLDVVPEQLEVADADRPDLLDLRDERLPFRLVRVAEVEPGRDRVREVDTHAVALRDELAQPIELVRGVRLAPPRAMVWVVLRRVHPGVQLVLRAEADEVEPLLVRPRRAVEPLDDAAHLHA